MGKEIIFVNLKRRKIMDERETFNLTLLIS
jgi:hypothetical protein